FAPAYSRVSRAVNLSLRSLPDTLREKLGDLQMNRRDMLLATGALWALSVAPRAAGAADATAAIAPAAHDLYERATVFDANAAPALQDSVPFPKEILD